VKREIIEIPDSSDDKWTRRRRTPGTGRRRVIRDPDSESEGEWSDGSRVDNLQSEEELDKEDEEKDDEDDEDDEYSRYDIAKHYDDSYGSLRNFIVDDQEDVSESAQSDEEEVDDNETTSSPRRPAFVLTPRRPVHASRILDLPDLGALSVDDSPPRTPSRSRPPISTKTSRKQWEAERKRIAADVFAELDKKVFEGKLKGTNIEWSKRLLTTAGTANSKRFGEDKLISGCRLMWCGSVRQKDGSKLEERKIVLSEKVLATEGELTHISTSVGVTMEHRSSPQHRCARDVPSYGSYWPDN